MVVAQSELFQRQSHASDAFDLFVVLLLLVLLETSIMDNVAVSPLFGAAFVVGWVHLTGALCFSVTQAIPLVLQHLPMLGQRLTYIRAFLWAMPERCQQIGVMVALGVDPVNWYRIK